MAYVLFGVYVALSVSMWYICGYVWCIHCVYCACDKWYVYMSYMLCNVPNINKVYMCVV